MAPTDLDSFIFRNLHPLLHIGTASDRYAGWLGQIYSRDLYQEKLTRRSHKVGEKSFIEEVLPVKSVEEYFQHFSVLEIDYTFYQTLVQADGTPSRTLHVLGTYKKHLRDEDRIVLKVPQAVTAQKIYRGRNYVANPTYLDATLFAEHFYRPAVELLGSCLAGFIFEQEYQRKQDRISPYAVAEALDTFFTALPEDSRYHLELRTESYLTPKLFDVLEKHGVGQVLSHWTWLPTLINQFKRSGQRFLNSGDDCIIRLLTPRGTRYKDAYAAAHPFAALVEGMMQPTMVEEAVSLLQEGISQGTAMNLIVNNRSGGNAPLIAQHVAREFVAPQNR